MAMVTHNGQTIGIADYVSLIIEAARKIIEREQREKGNLDKSGISLISADAPEDRLTNSESETPKEMENTAPNSSVMLRLPDGTLQSVEDYIVGIIKDASSQIEKERQNTSITADDILDKSADVENVQQIPPKPELNNSTHGKHSTPSKAAKVSSPRAGPVSKVLSRIFKRGKTKEKEKPKDEVIHGFDESQTTDRAAEDGYSPIKPEPGSPNSIHSEEITAHVATENHQSPGKDSKQEIPKGKGKLKKKNSLRKMLSCFSTKAAQAD